jgi:hypothetical protein
MVFKSEMRLTTEIIALKILAALNAEHEREPSLLKCRALNDILTEVGNKNHLTQPQVAAAVRQLVANGHIKAVDRPPNGKAALPSDKGLAFLASHDAINKEKTELTLDRRLIVYGIIVSIIAIISTWQCWHR